MDQSFDQYLPFAVGGFVVLLVLSHFLQRKLRRRNLIQLGQLPSDGARIPSIEERLAANKVWRSGVIRSNGRAFVIVLWVLTLTWNLTFGVSFFKFLFDPDAQTGGTIVLGLFSVVGIGIAAFAVRATIGFFRFGESTCSIDGKAGVLGGRMAGRIVTSANVPATGPYKLILECLEFYHSGSGNNRKLESRIHWQSIQEVPQNGHNSRAGIPFSFQLPPYPPETGYQLARGNISWQLRVSAPVEGVDYSATFVVPVFKMD